MYANSNPKSGAALKRELAAALAAGRDGIQCHQPGPFGPDVRDGVSVCEGPHFPQAHSFYLRCEVRNGMIVKVLR